jgi:hypothetical protein
MASKEDILREKTHKEDGIEIERRIFYTLDDAKSEGLQGHRNSKAISMLIKALREKDFLTDTDIDDILFEAIN